MGVDLTAHLAEVVASQVGSIVPGLVIAVVDREGVLSAGAWGRASISQSSAMTMDTSCNWFSMTKPVTATTMVQLADRGLIDLDVPLVDYYEPWSGLRPASRRDQVTARHLLAHSAGLANPLPLRWTHLPGEPGPDLGEFVARQLGRNRRLRFDPGTKAVYSNLGYLVAGHLIEAVTGDSFSQVVEDGVLAPLAMSATGFTASDRSMWATGYHRRTAIKGTLLPLLVPREILGANEGSYQALLPFHVDGAPYGGLIGPAVDAARFLRAHLGDGELDGVRILEPESARAMRTLSTVGKNLQVGLGWYHRGPTSDAGFVEHLGGGAGFWTCMRLYPDSGLGVLLMGNATSYDHDSIARAAISQHAP
jgi:CubicO group peptidase (beta-lactamase class C family)